MIAARKVLTAGWVVLSAALSACGSSQTTHYHALEPQSRTDQAVTAYAGPIIQITAFNIPAIFDREELLKEISPGQFEVDEFDHWAAPFAQLARQTFAADLAARLPAGMLSPPGSPIPSRASQLAINLESYHVAGSSAVLQVSWSYRDPAGSPEGWQTQSMSLQADAGDRGGSATAAAVNQLLAELADQIAQSLGRQSSSTK